MAKPISSIIIVLFSFLSISTGFEILQFVPAWVGSVRMFNDRLGVALSRSNSGSNDSPRNQVTLIEEILHELPHPFKYSKELRLRKYYALADPDTSEDLMSVLDDMVYKSLSFDIIYKMAVGVAQMHGNACQQRLGNEEFHRFLNESKYQLAFSHPYAMCSIVMAHDAGIPTAFYSAGTYILDQMAALMNIPFTASFIPNAVTSLTDRMSFKERLLNTGLAALGVISFRGTGHPFTAEKKFLLGSPYEDRANDPLDVIAYAPLLLLNGYSLLDFPRPNTPNIHYVGNWDNKKGPAKSLNVVIQKRR